MPMIDTLKYNTTWWVHEEDECFWDGNEYQSQSEAEDAALTEAEYHSDNYVYVITEVHTKALSQTKVEVKRKISLETI